MAAIEISTASGLNDIRLNLAADYILTADIDLAGYANWEPIGTQAAPFTGTLDGNDYTISNLTIDRATTDYIGLFGYCQFNNSVKIPNLKNIKITGADVTGQDYVGIVAGYIGTTLGSTGDALAGDPGVGTIISGCTTAGTVSGRTNVGGIFGMAQGPEFAGYKQSESIYNYAVLDWWIGCITGLSSSAAVTGSGENIGGLIGYLYELSVRMGNSTGAVTGGDIIGGIIGYGYRCDIKTCYTTGNITGTKRVGGIIGVANYRPIIEYCYSEGDIKGTGGSYPGVTYRTAAGVGGIVGVTDADQVRCCYSIGQISAVYRAGGIIGAYIDGSYATDNICCCYARGNISVSGSQVGGLIGYIWAGLVDIEQCYCTGKVTGWMSGAVIGVRGSYVDWGEEYSMINPNWDKPVGQIYYDTDIFYNADVNTASTQHGGTGKTSLDLQKVSTYEQAGKSWANFSRNWVIDDDEGDPYPQLKCFYEPYGLSISLVSGAPGLTLAYTKGQELFYRQLDDTWGAETQVEGISEINTLNTFRTAYGCIGFIMDEAGTLKCALTKANSMEIDSIKTLTKGTYGDIVESPDSEAFLLYVTEAGSMNQLVGSTADGWEALTFDSAKPIPSDSQIAHLRANIYGSDGYVVWRSRGQHRLMVLSLAKPPEEGHLLRGGSITMSLGSPVVSVSIEFDDEVVV